MIELERKWKLKNRPPEDKIKDTFLIEQIWTGNDPKSRIRKETRKLSDGQDQIEYTHTTKYRINDYSELEINVFLSNEQYSIIINLYENEKHTVKQRTLVDLENGLVAEIDEYIDEDRSTVEVEFPVKEVSDSFIPPDWFGEEIKRESFSKDFLWK